jgi:hypothetical protein
MLCACVHVVCLVPPVPIASTLHQHQAAHYPLCPPARQLVPGVILMSDVQRAQASNQYVANGVNGQVPPHAGGVQPADMNTVKFSPATTAAIAKELLDTGEQLEEQFHWFKNYILKKRI